MLCIEDQLWFAVVTVSSAGGGEGVRREWIMHLELSRAGHDGTIFAPSVGTAVPREVRRYHPCTRRRYDGTTPVLGNGPNTVSGSTVSNTELSEFFGVH